ncbi:MAG: hypothetical protein NT001_03525 [Candidatus Woesearchaeota archaeon]|nr:hypothetical protein [Candidatus Woesearchaeota archaeon]
MFWGCSRKGKEKQVDRRPTHIWQYSDLSAEDVLYYLISGVPETTEVERDETGKVISTLSRYKYDRVGYNPRLNEIVSDVPLKIGQIPGDLRDCKFDPADISPAKQKNDDAFIRIITNADEELRGCPASIGYLDLDHFERILRATEYKAGDLETELHEKNTIILGNVKKASDLIKAKLGLVTHAYVNNCGYRMLIGQENMFTATHDFHDRFDNRPGVFHLLPYNDDDIFVDMELVDTSGEIVVPTFTVMRIDMYDSVRITNESYNHNLLEAITRETGVRYRQMRHSDNSFEFVHSLEIDDADKLPESIEMIKKARDAFKGLYGKDSVSIIQGLVREYLAAEKQAEQKR